jgi:hypothetical protein
MDATEAEKTTESVETTSVKAEAATAGKVEAALAAQDIVPFIDKVVAPPVAELARLIEELTETRTHLACEGERIQREVGRYLQLNENTVESIRIIAGAVTEWRTAGHPTE